MNFHTSQKWRVTPVRSSSGGCTTSPGSSHPSRSVCAYISVCVCVRVCVRVCVYVCRVLYMNTCLIAICVFSMLVFTCSFGVCGCTTNTALRSKCIQVSVLPLFVCSCYRSVRLCLLIVGFSFLKLFLNYGYY
jgi:hypothetical protein